VTDTHSFQAVILIVEDEALLRMSLADSLRDCGFLPIEACNADEAVEILEMDVEIDVVLTDVRMPGNMDGFGLAKWIRENRPELPVFVASGYSGKFDLAEELCASEAYFTKPFNVSEVAPKLKAAAHARRLKYGKLI